MSDNPDLTQRIADILWGYFAEIRRDGYIVDGVDGDTLAEAVVAALNREIGQLPTQLNLSGRESVALSDLRRVLGEDQQ